MKSYRLPPALRPLPATCLLCCLVFGQTQTVAAAFPAGHLLIADYEGVHLVNPDNGATQTLVTNLTTGVGDVVYNQVSDSAFLTVNRRVIVELKAAGGGRFTTTTFLSPVEDVETLAVDRFGNLYFNESAFVAHYIARVDLQGKTEVVSDDDFFVPRGIALSADETQLFVAQSPDNGVAVLDLATRQSRSLSDSIAFPEGIAALPSGDVLVVENPIGGRPRILRLTPNGDESTYATLDQEHSHLGAIAFDATNATLYVASWDGIYAVAVDGSSRRVTTRGNWSSGFALITVRASVQITRHPQPQILALGMPGEFQVEVDGEGWPVRYQWRLNGAVIPGATGPSHRIDSVRETDAGTYSVLVVTARGAALSQDAALALTGIQLQPVI